ncbi:VLRF1 family aeRF1-type release factor [Nocardiopsis mangrovi]|uniref:VLRF1 family aeRF1-type release factor n=1 Tax=Nocardiopsis mangrovi TaxID=1179818 RepID=A0ABV9DX49_9ACTN
MREHLPVPREKHSTMGGMIMILDHTSLRDLAGMTDDMGVLSVYATADPRDTSASPAWRLQVAQAIDALRDQAAEDGDRERKNAVLHRLDRLGPEIDSMLDVATSGLGRALFAPVNGDDVRTLAVQMPLEDCAHLESRPYLRPLAAALTTDGPAGVIAVSRDGVRVIDLRFGVSHELTRFGFEMENEDWRPSRRSMAAGGSGPASAARAYSGEDRFGRSIDEHLLRFFGSVRPRIRAIADREGWETIAITGEARLLSVVRKGLESAGGHRDIVMLDHVVEHKSVPEIAAIVQPELHARRLERCEAVADEVRSTALAGGNGTVGLSDTLGAFREGRVSHLFLDGERHLSGHRGPDGAYYPQGETPPGTEAAQMVPEHDLGERMIELGLNSGADVTVLPPGPADTLIEDGGVAAMLRW